ncbi:MAG: hypothetical protein ACRDT4_05070 [Micromonosporaceae bacterium]
MDASDKRMALGVGGAVAACCAVHLIILAGGIGALGSVLGGLLSSPYLLVGGLGLLTGAIVALTRPRANRTGDDGGRRPT